VGVFFVRRLTDATEDLLLSFAAGIMLAACFFSLLAGFVVMMFLDATLG